MRVYIRTDSSVQIGAGHVMRCLTLADSLRELGAEIAFACRDLEGNLNDAIARKGYEVHVLPPAPEGDQGKDQTAWTVDAEETGKVLSERGRKIDWLIVDHYALGDTWEARTREHVRKLMVIDDLVGRPHHCDLFLNQNVDTDIGSGYDTLLPNDCAKLLGPRYALLRPEFKDARNMARRRDGGIDRLLVSFGATDPTNETSKALKAIATLENRYAVDVVVGSANPHKDQVREFCSTLDNASYYCQTENMARLMSEADLAIGASGSSTWERCCLGLPALVTAFSDGEYWLALSAEKFGVVENMGWGCDLTPEKYLERLKDVGVRDLTEMSAKGMDLVDGEGSNRVAEEIYSQ